MYATGLRLQGQHSDAVCGEQAAQLRLVDVGRGGLRRGLRGRRHARHAAHAAHAAHAGHAHAAGRHARHRHHLLRARQRRRDRGWVLLTNNCHLAFYNFMFIMFYRLFPQNNTCKLSILPKMNDYFKLLKSSKLYKENANLI